MNLTTTQSSKDASRCQAALQGTLESMELIAPEHWRVRTGDSAVPPLLARLTEGFLALSGEFSPSPGSTHWDLVTANAGLSGLVKFSSPSAGGLSLQAEIPFQGESEFPLRLEQTGRAFSAALNPALNHNGEAIGGDSETRRPDLTQLVEEAGWRCASRRADRCTVALDTLRGVRTALITAERGTTRVCTELTSWDSLSNACREAVALLLLSANARLRLARAVVVEEKEGGGAAQLEVVFEGMVSPAEMRCALEALSVGANLCAPAAEMLQQETAAELFLAMRGGPCDREDTQQTTERKSQV